MSESTTKITLEDFVHVGPDTLMGRWMRTFWQPVILADELAPGRAKPVQVLGETITVYRGESGDFHAVAQRCAHRGTPLATGWVEGDSIRCLYHGWRYDGSGQCLEQPDEHDKFCHRIKVAGYPVQPYLGLVFVYLGEGEPPELPRFPNFDGVDGGILGNSSYVWPCSYLNGQENDSYHGNWVHRDQYAANGRLAKPGGMNVEVEATSYGFVSRIRREGARRFRQSRTHTLMPNMRMRRASGNRSGVGDKGWQVAIRWSVPVDDTTFKNLSATMTHVDGEEKRQQFLEGRERRASQLAELQPATEIAEAALRGDVTTRSFPGQLGVDDPRMFGVGDYATQVGQGIEGLLNDNHLGRGDVEVAMLRRIYRRELSALANGQPLTQWELPEEFVVRVSED